MGRLIQIELLNFKSYKGHQTIGPFHDFTSIIGPNGAGKSNLMDAISFVLGIKSSHLRSSHLKDLIYRGRTMAGEEEAEQEGQGGDDDDDNNPRKAWVMAVYEDDDGKEIKFKRTITPQGTSEYRIDGSTVTASQYNRRLEEQNVLIKARNFLVFQGDVEAIASQSPKDLTKLIEQISGSLELKADYERLKAEQEKAVEASTHNFHKKRGINAEIKQYTEQKREAEEFTQKEAEKDQAIVNHVLWKLFHFEKGIEESRAEVDRVNEERKRLKQEQEKAEKGLEAARKDHAKVQKDILKQERGMKKKEKQVEDIQPGLLGVDEKINVATKNVKKFHNKIAEVRKDQDRQSKQVDDLRKQLDTVEKAEKKFEQEQRKAAREAGQTLSEDDLAEYRRLKEEVNRRAAGDKIKLDSAARQAKTDGEAVRSLRDKLDALEQQRSRLLEERSDAKDKKRELDAEITQLLQDLDDKKREHEHAQSERLRTAQTETELNEKLQQTLNKLLEANASTRESEREAKFRETLAALQRIFPGVRGRITDLCKPSQRKYDTAVSVVLGRNIDAVVVDTEKVAKDCIEYLRDQRAGQATFLPLDTIQVKPVDANLRGIHKGARMAIDVVQYESSLERAMQYACGNAVICDDLKVARDICYDMGKEVKAVALDGTVIHKSGLITGGRAGVGSASKRWEEQEVEGLKRVRDTLMAQIKEIQANSRRGGEEEGLMAEVNRIEGQLTTAREKLSATSRAVESKKEEIAHIAGQIEELQPKLQQEEEALEEVEGRLAELQAAFNEVEDEVFAEFVQRIGVRNIRQYEERQGMWAQEAAEKRAKFLTQKSKIENQLSFEEKRLAETTARIENLEASIARDEQMLEQLQAEKTEFQNEIDTLSAELELLREAHTNRKADLEQRNEAVSEAKRAVTKWNKDLDRIARTVTTLVAEVERIAAERHNLLKRCKVEEIDIPLLAGSLDDVPMEEQLRQDVMELDDEGESAHVRTEIPDYGLEFDFDELDDDLKEDGSSSVEADLLDTIKNITAELERMSPNMKAIERLEGVENRLQDTEKDFDKARREAKNARDKFTAVKQKRYDLFNRAYTHIAEQIDKIYKDLTKSKAFPLGGTAYLSLEDSEEPYLDGVKYHAMPPMKRFRDMEQLSGGEKTMAALALLFAIHSYQPSPFFVLDEVDAALDNTNVAHVANYIREHAGPGFQFIVISLKNGLFHQSEALVGIYRDQDENSSKPLTLDLRKYPE
ncbi:Structural maintenance of chromosomes protein 1 [Saitoella coloradoensis]